MVVAFTSDHTLVSRTQLRRARARAIARREACLGLRVEASVDVMAPNRIRAVKVSAAQRDHERRHRLLDKSTTRARREYCRSAPNRILNAVVEARIGAAGGFPRVESAGSGRWRLRRHPAA